MGIILIAPQAKGKLSPLQENCGSVRLLIQSLSPCSKSSERVRCVAQKLHPQAGPFVDALLASELTVHLQ